MSTIYNSIPSTSPRGEDMSSEQEQELMSEEILGEEYTQELTDQDDSQSGGDSDSKDGGSDSSAGEAHRVESTSAEETTTVPETFFSAMAYSIEAYLAAIDAQQDAALMNIDLYTEQVKQQHETAKSLAKTVRERFRADAKKMFMDAAMSFASAGISFGQNYYGSKATSRNAPELTKTMAQREAMQDHYSNIGNGPGVISTLGNTKKPVDPVRTALDNAEVAPVINSTRTNNLPADVAANLKPTQRADYARRLRENINAADQKISGIRQDNQMGHTMAQTYGELAKSLFQGAFGVGKAYVDIEISKLEHAKVMYENIKDLIGSLIQQIQGRVSTSSKGMLDSIDTLRNAIRQFQG